MPDNISLMPDNEQPLPDPTRVPDTLRSFPSGGDRVLATLAVIASANALWAVFLWRELVRARAGETPFCGFGESVDCGTLWSASFASAIHNATGVPVAGWGLVWALVAAFLPLAALSLHGGERRQTAIHTAIELTAAAGVAGIIVLLAASAAEGLFCTSCALTYVLTLAYAGITLFVLSRRFRSSSPGGGQVESSPGGGQVESSPEGGQTQGVILAVAATAGVYLLLLYPGLKTPKSAAEEGQRALRDAGRAAEQTAGGPQDTGAGAAGGRQTQRGQGEGRLVGGVDVDRVLEEFVAGLKPRTSQGLSDTLLIYRQGRELAPEPPRLLALGTADARVQITEFSDVLCSHCATLHQTMTQLSTLLPPGSFNLDARHFPLDGRCNPHMRPRDDEDGVRCLAARTLICAEDTGNSFELMGSLFAHQRDLTSEQVYQLAAPFIDRDALEQCLNSDATTSKLAQDIEYAWFYEPHGTPLVVVNGRQGNPFPPFLYAVILAGGDPDHPAFASLPTPNPPQPHDHEH